MTPAQDTIVAIATAPGAGGVGIVRLSGPAAQAIAKVVCARALSPRQAHHVRFLDAGGGTIDDGIVLSFPGPASFTGEDVVELQAHGSPVVLQQLVARACALGARMARPGEFSERAFLNHKLDLAQAEAIADLIAAARPGARSTASSPTASRTSAVRCWPCACMSRRRSISPTNPSTRSAANRCARAWRMRDSGSMR